jgi:hypothetical protein
VREGCLCVCEGVFVCVCMYMQGCVRGEGSDKDRESVRRGDVRYRVRSKTMCQLQSNDKQ